MSDAELLQRFAGHQDDAAFEVLVRRHGGMVLRVCERVLRHRQDAEDAFQATFTVLARKAGALASGELAGWLHGVAYRVASKARAGLFRQRRQEFPRREEAVMPGASADLRPLLDEELGKLPEQCRLPVILCYLEGRTNAEAAQAMQCSVPTIERRLREGRELLRERLHRRGITCTAVLLLAVLTEEVSAAVPMALVTATVQAGAAAAGSAGFFAKLGGIVSTWSVKAKAAAAAAAATITTVGVVYLTAGTGDWKVTATYAEPAAAVAFSTDGNFFACAERDQQLRIRNARNGALIATFYNFRLGNNTDDVILLSFHSASNSLAWCDAENRVTLWDVPRERGRVLQGPHPSRMAAMRISDDGATLAWLAWNGRLCRNDIRSGKTETIEMGRPGQVIIDSAIFTPDTRKAIYTTASGAIWIFDVRTRKSKLICNAQDLLHGLAAIVLDVDSGRVLHELHSDERARFGVRVALSADGTKLAYGVAPALAYAADGNLLAIGTTSGAIEVWNLKTGVQHRFSAHTSYLTSLAIAPDGQSLLSAGSDRTVKLWRLASAEPAQ
ncbi:MAG: sigma-70 family RNA polymerase sigma factor [Gemmataceae bacterium]